MLELCKTINEYLNSFLQKSLILLTNEGINRKTFGVKPHRLDLSLTTVVYKKLSRGEYGIFSIETFISDFFFGVLLKALSHLQKKSGLLNIGLYTCTFIQYTQPVQYSTEKCNSAVYSIYCNIARYKSSEVHCAVK